MPAGTTVAVEPRQMKETDQATDAAKAHQLAEQLAQMALGCHARRQRRQHQAVQAQAAREASLIHGTPHGTSYFLCREQSGGV